MRVDPSRKLFAGVRIDGRMREQLEKCPQRDRVYFESPDVRFLTVLRGGEDTYLGKILDAATPLATIDDVRRNVWSIIQRICPGRRDEGEIKLYVLDNSDVEPTLTSSGRAHLPPGHAPGQPGGPSSLPAGGLHSGLPSRDLDEDDYL